MDALPQEDIKQQGSEAATLAVLYFTRGQVYAAMQNLPKARQWYRAALETDVLCYPAYQVSAVQLGLLDGGTHASCYQY